MGRKGLGTGCTVGVNNKVGDELKYYYRGYIPTRNCMIFALILCLLTAKTDAGLKTNTTARTIRLIGRTNCPVFRNDSWQGQFGGTTGMQGINDRDTIRNRIKKSKK